MNGEDGYIKVNDGNEEYVDNFAKTLLKAWKEDGEEVSYIGKEYKKHMWNYNNNKSEMLCLHCYTWFSYKDYGWQCPNCKEYLE